MISPPTRIALIMAGWALASLPLACASVTQEARIAAQDFRFVPQEVHLRAHQPVRLVVLNEGREPHVFSSPLLADAAVKISSVPADAADSRTDSVPIQPGQSLEVRFTPNPGVYEIRCLVRGHAGMRGMVIVEG